MFIKKLISLTCNSFFFFWGGGRIKFCFHNFVFTNLTFLDKESDSMRLELFFLIFNCNEYVFSSLASADLFPAKFRSGGKKHTACLKTPKNDNIFRKKSPKHTNFVRTLRLPLPRPANAHSFVIELISLFGSS